MTTATPVAQVTIRVLLFAQLRGRFGADELVVSLPSGSTGHDLMRWCAQRAPQVKDLLAVSRLAVNGEYTAREHVLKDGDEVAIIPPVSGG